MYSNDLQINSRIKRLEESLFFAHQLVLSLIPEKYRSIMESYSSCESIDDTYSWKRRVCDEIISCAETLDVDQGSYFQPRAYCPLCGEGSSSPYDQGFAVPEGLKRHLSGWGGNRGCEVINLTSHYAREYWDRKFKSIVETERMDKALTLERRMKSETIYLVDPNSDPKLLDTEKAFFPSRSGEEIEWAENRLAELGFVESLASNVKSFTDVKENIIIYADPTVHGKITFIAYKSPFKRRSKRLATFEIRDSWKNGLKAKYEDWVKETASN